MTLNRVLSALGLAATMLSATVAQAAVTTYTDLAKWKVDVGTYQGTAVVPGFDFDNPTSVVLSGGSTLDAFSSPVQHLTVGSTWLTWPHQPGSDGTTVFYSSGANSLSFDFSPGVVLAGVNRAERVDAFGFFVEPNPFGEFKITLDLSTGESITQTVDGLGGAKFFGWAGGTVTGLTLSSEVDFAFGDFYEGSLVPIPEPGTYALFALGLGGLVLVRRRRT
ncbi:PEP-CTERM sorting domain-containing protein [Aquabacterium sp. A7-Y]|uniref:PEP-CTERM sorting domain-containing protein n=1 Tax=Aquabacterium sp. A7-Y TaxID=1349605 RepID=UPI00223DD173|nr:PEP-CTERM sorting domain-containing protein [Aquabacterium sp. A7-Y]MCW7539272.1 PEP-CTERM sorting domain-containing protein [Aquabacterium sp. A7-Y]